MSVRTKPAQSADTWVTITSAEEQLPWLVKLRYCHAHNLIGSTLFLVVYVLLVNAVLTGTSFWLALALLPVVYTVATICGLLLMLVYVTKCVPQGHDRYFRWRKQQMLRYFAVIQAYQTKLNDGVKWRPCTGDVHPQGRDDTQARWRVKEQHHAGGVDVIIEHWVYGHGPVVYVAKMGKLWSLPQTVTWNRTERRHVATTDAEDTQQRSKAWNRAKALCEVERGNPVEQLHQQATALTSDDFLTAMRRRRK